MIEILGKMANSRRKETLDRQIDDNIRRVYAEMADEPLPDRFSQLLDQLRQQEGSKDKDESGSDK